MQRSLLKEGFAQVVIANKVKQSSETLDRHVALRLVMTVI
jgi:hypothetical protein